METGEVALSMTGDKLYQNRARQALPILVRQALASAPIYYSDLASELGMPNARNLNYVLGSIGNTINELGKKWKERIPPIQCIVLNKNTGLPGEGISWFLIKKEEFRKLTRKQKKAIVDAELQQIYAYKYWHEVLKALALKPIAEDFTTLVQHARSYGGKGEGEEHRKLKEYVAAHPEIIGLPPTTVGQVEYCLPSGDSIDVLFEHKQEWFAIEVKPSTSPIADLVRGLFQCVKYQALMEAVQASQKRKQNAQTFLVLAGTLPEALVPLKNILGIQVIESVNAS